jgi:hypothetical protein
MVDNNNNEEGKNIHNEISKSQQFPPTFLTSPTGVTSSTGQAVQKSIGAIPSMRGSVPMINT